MPCRIRERHTHDGLSRLGWFGNCEPRILFISGTRGDGDRKAGISDTADDNFVGCGSNVMSDGWRRSFPRQVTRLSTALAKELNWPCACWMVANLAPDQHNNADEAGRCSNCAPYLAPGGLGEKEVLAIARHLRPRLVVSADRDLFNPFRDGTARVLHSWEYPNSGVGEWNEFPIIIPPYKLSARFSAPHSRLDGQKRDWGAAWDGYAERAAHSPALRMIAKRD